MNEMKPKEWLNLGRKALGVVNARANDKWDAAFQAYRGIVADNVRRELPFDIPVGNMIYVTLAHMLSAMFDVEPDFVVRPRKSVFSEGAKACGAALNYWWGEVDPQMEVELAWVCQKLCGYSILLSGYHADLDYEADTDGSLAPVHVNSERPILVQVPNRQFAIDPVYSNMKEARWVVRRFLKPLDEIIDSPLYNTGIARKIAAKNGIFHGPMSVTAGQSQVYQDANQPESQERKTDQLEIAKGDKLIWLYEFTVRDKRLGRSIRTIAEGTGEWLRNEPDGSPIEGFPYYKLESFPMPDSWFPVSEFDQWKPLQDEKARLRGYFLEAIKRMLPRLGVKQGAWTPDQLDAFAANPLAVVELDQIDEAHVRELLGKGSIGADAFRVAEMNDADSMAVTGINEYRRNSGGSVRTATETEAMQQGFTALAQRNFMKLSHCYRWIGRTWLQLLQTYGPAQLEIAVENDRQAAGLEDLDISRRAVQGEYQLTIDVGRLKRQGRGAERETLVQLLQVIGESPDVDHRKLVQRILEAFSDDIRGVDEIMKQENENRPPTQEDMLAPPPMEQADEEMYKPPMVGAA